MESCEKRAPAWSADGIHVVVVEHETTEGQRVQVGSEDLVGAVETDVVPALCTKIRRRRSSRSSALGVVTTLVYQTHQVVRHDEDYVGPGATVAAACSHS